MGKNSLTKEFRYTFEPALNSAGQAILRASTVPTCCHTSVTPRVVSNILAIFILGYRLAHH